MTLKLVENLIKVQTLMRDERFTCRLPEYYTFTGDILDF